MCPDCTIIDLPIKEWYPLKYNSSDYHSHCKLSFISLFGMFTIKTIFFSKMSTFRIEVFKQVYICMKQKFVTRLIKFSKTKEHSYCNFLTWLQRQFLWISFGDRYVLLLTQQEVPHDFILKKTWSTEEEKHKRKNSGCVMRYWIVNLSFSSQV